MYANSCDWFMYDRATMDCKLFKGSLSDLVDDCTEFGYAVSPSYANCNYANVADPKYGCYVRKIFHYNIVLAITEIFYNLFISLDF